MWWGSRRWRWRHGRKCVLASALGNAALTNPKRPYKSTAVNPDNSPESGCRVVMLGVTTLKRPSRRRQRASVGRQEMRLGCRLGLSGKNLHAIHFHTRALWLPGSDNRSSQFHCSDPPSSVAAILGRDGIGARGRPLLIIRFQAALGTYCTTMPRNDIVNGPSRWISIAI